MSIKAKRKPAKKVSKSKRSPVKTVSNKKLDLYSEKQFKKFNEIADGVMVDTMDRLMTAKADRENSIFVLSKLVGTWLAVLTRLSKSKDEATIVTRFIGAVQDKAEETLEAP